MLGLICFFIEEQMQFSDVEARFSQEHVKVSRYFLNDFVIEGPNHPPSPFSFAVLVHDKDSAARRMHPSSLGYGVASG
jgi:hypothetical protein